MSRKVVFLLAILVSTVLFGCAKVTKESNPSEEVTGATTKVAPQVEADRDEVVSIAGTEKESVVENVTTKAEEPNRGVAVGEAISEVQTETQFKTQVQLGTVEEATSKQESVTEKSKEKETKPRPTTEATKSTEKETTKEQSTTAKEVMSTEAVSKAEATTSASGTEAKKRILTSYEEIMAAILEGFNYARAQKGYEPVSFDARLSQDCEEWAKNMASKGTTVHSDMAYSKKYRPTYGTGSSEGVGNMNLSCEGTLTMENGQLVYKNVIQYEYENYVTYETAFSEGKLMCVHIGANEREVGLVGYGIAIGKTSHGTLDYFTCAAIIY